MAQIVKPIYTQEDIWGGEGAKTLPPSAKIKKGWGQEMMPAEYENWIQNRQDQAIAYLYQFGIPEWDTLTEYIANKSLVQQDGRIYRAIQTSTNVPPTQVSHWTNILTGLGYVTISGPNGAAQVPSGTTSQRPSAEDPTGTVNLRYNVTTKRWEFFADGSWIELIDKSLGVTGTGKIVLENSPTFLGNPKVPTQPATDNSTNAASTAFVKNALDARQNSGSEALKPKSSTNTVLVGTTQDFALPLVSGATAYLMLSLETSGGTGDLWDVEIYDSTPTANNLLYYSRLITGEFKDRIPILLTTAMPIVRIVNQRADGNASNVKVVVSTISCN